MNITTTTLARSGARKSIPDSKFRYESIQAVELVRPSPLTRTGIGAQVECRLANYSLAAIDNIVGNAHPTRSSFMCEETFADRIEITEKTSDQSIQ